MIMLLFIKIINLFFKLEKKIKEYMDKTYKYKNNNLSISTIHEDLLNI